MRKFAVCWLLLVVSALAQNAKQDLTAQESKLLVLEHLWNEAQVGRDASALQSMISDRFINTEWDGEVSDRDKFLADIRDPRFKPTALSIQDVKVSSYRDTAIITGVYHAKGTYQGKPYDHVGRFTDTWIYDSGKWQCVASHTSLLKK
jgi:ketosteroid isomerase-like protein